MSPDEMEGQNRGCRVILDGRRSPVGLSRWENQGARLWLQPQIQLCFLGLRSGLRILSLQGVITSNT